VTSEKVPAPLMRIDLKKSITQGKEKTKHPRLSEGGEDISS